MRHSPTKPLSDRACPTLRLARMVAAAVGLAMAAQSAAAFGTITNLGTLGGPQSVANAISADGSTVVGSSFTSNGSSFAFRWTRQGGMVSLWDGDGQAFAISSDASTVVGSGTVNGFTVPFRWTSAGAQALALPSGYVEGAACSSNANGSVVGGSMSGPNSLRASFRWTSSTGVRSIGKLGNGGYPPWSVALGMNSAGTVIVGQSNDNTGPKAYRWTASSGMVSLGTVASPSGWSGAEAITPDGNVIVGFSEISSSKINAMRWTAVGGMVSLGTVPGFSTSYALAQNSDGSRCVGFLSTIDYQTREAAMLWTSTLGMVNLNTYLPSIGIDITGWTLQSATGISADGMTITGTGRYNGATRAWVVTGVPAPSASSLFVLVALAGTRRRSHSTFLVMQQPRSRLIAALQRAEDAVS